MVKLVSVRLTIRIRHSTTLVRFDSNIKRVNGGVWFQSSDLEGTISARSGRQICELSVTKSSIS